MSESIPSTEFGRSFIYVAALPKSASSLMWLVVSALQEESGRADPSKLPNVSPSPFAPLQFELMDKFRQGGTFSGHAPLTFDTDLFLRGTQCRYVVHLRHPADFVVALLCHGRDARIDRFIPAHLFARIDQPTMDDRPRWSYALSAVDSSTFDEDTPLDEAITHLLRDGVLFKAMAWMCDWLAYRDPGRSIVSTYEGLMTDFEATIGRLCRFVRGTLIDDYRIDYLRYVMNYEAEKSKQENLSRYPRGWTGEVGVWRRYFTSDHISIYNKTVTRFLMCYPKASALLAEYGDLTISETRWRQTG
jgi:Sulfotransferase domain